MRCFHFCLPTLLGLLLSWQMPVDSAQRQKEGVRDQFYYHLQNQQAELETLQERLNNQEESFESLRRDLDKTIKDVAHKQESDFKQQIEQIEQHLKLAMGDLTKMRGQINDKFMAIDLELKNAFASLERQAVHTAHLEKATQTLLSLLEGKSAPASALETGQKYVVKSGDSLDRIAKRHGTSVEALKALNAIGDNNIIYPGQTLTIP